MEDRIPGGLQHHHKTCCEKGGRHRRRACMVQRWHRRRDVVFRTGGLVYDTIEIYKPQEAFHFFYPGRSLPFFDCFDFINFYLYLSSPNYYF